MHRSGVACDQKLKDEFNAVCEDEKKLYMKVEIKDENFVKVGEGDVGENQNENWQIAQNALKEKSPCYLLIRSEKKDQWVLCYFVPDDAVVKKKMLIASSYADLKSGLGQQKFVHEYPISAKGECTYDAYIKATNKKTDDVGVMSWQERQAKEIAYEETTQMTETKVSAVVGLPIPMTDEATAAMNKFKEKEINTIILALDIEKEELGVGDNGTLSFEEFVGKLPEREPRYVLHSFEHDREGSTKTNNIFVYYCPDKSKPRLRMFYSTAKSSALGLMNQLKIEESTRIEISLASELTKQMVLDELYPKDTKKKVFKKPVRKGKGKAKFHGSKFQAR